MRPIESKFLDPIILRVKGFFVHKLIPLTCCFNRGSFLSIILLLIREFFILQVSFAEPTIDRDFGLLEDVFEPYYKKDSDFALIMQIGCVTLNTIIISYLLLAVICDFSVGNRISVLFSIILMTYEYIFCIFQLSLSFTYVSTALSIINAFISQILGIFIVLIDYSIDFNPLDKLKRYDSSLNMTNYFLDVILVFSYNFTTTQVQISLMLIFTFLKLISALKAHTYINEQSQQIYMTLQVFKMLLCVGLFLFSNQYVDFQLFFAILLMSIPMSVISLDSFESYYRTQLVAQLIENQASNNQFFTILMRNTHINVDLACRMLFDYMTRKDLTFVSKKDIQIHQLYHSVISQQKGYQQQDKIATQLKDQMKESDGERQQILQQHNGVQHVDIGISLEEARERKLICSFIKRRYKEILSENNGKITDLHFSYLYFLISSESNECVSLNALCNIEIQYRGKTSLKDQQKLQTISEIVGLQADLHTFIATRQENKQSIFTQNNKSTNELNSDILELFSVISFDLTMQGLQRSYLESLKLQKTALIEISKNHIELNSAQTALQGFRKHREALHTDITALIVTHTFSQHLRNICNNFDNFLDQNADLTILFMKIFRQSHSQRQANKDYYDPRSSLAFVSLLRQSEGQISLHSKGFLKMFGCIPKLSQTIKKTIGQQVQLNQMNFNNFFKDSVKSLRIFQSPDDSCSNFISENFTYYREIYNVPLILARDFQGYALPITARIQPEKSKDNDFGFVIWCKPLLNDFVYVLLDSQRPQQISCMSRRFQEEFLFDGFTLQYLSKIKIDVLIPSVKEYVTKENTSNEDTIIDESITLENVLLIGIGNQSQFQEIISKTNDKSQKNIQDVKFSNKLAINSSNYASTIGTFPLFTANITYKRIKNKLLDMTFLQIESFSALKKKGDIVQAIKEVQEKLTGKKDVEQQLDPLLQSIYSQNSRSQVIKVAPVRDNPENTNTPKSPFSSPNVSPSSPSQLPGLQIFHVDKSEFSSGTEPTRISQEGQKSSKITFTKKDSATFTQFEQEDTQRIINPLLDSRVLDAPQDEVKEGEITDRKTELTGRDEELSQLESDRKMIINDQTFEESNIDPSRTAQNLLRGRTQITDENIKNNISANGYGYEYTLQNTSKDNTPGKNKNFNGSFQENPNTPIPQNSSQLDQKSVPDAQQNSNQLNESKHGNTIQLNQVDTNTETHFEQTQQEHEPTKMKNQVDQPSIASSQHSVTNRQLIKMIHAKKELIQLKIINLLGLFSILITLVLTIYGFYVLYSRMIQQQVNFKYTNWLYYMNFQISQAYSEQNMKLLLIAGLWKMPLAADNKQMMDMLNLSLSQRFNNSIDLLRMNQNATGTSIEVFNIIKDFPITQTLFNSNTNKNQYDVPVTLLYALQMQVGTISQFIYNRDSQQQFRYTGRMNYPIINKALQEVNNGVDSQFRFQIDEMRTQTKIQLFIVLSVSCIFLLCIIPTYMIAIKKEQEVLQLLSTFSVQCLTEMLNTNSSADSTSILQSHMTSERSPQQLTSTQVGVTKKNNISTTSRLNYSLKLLVFCLLIFFLIIMVYPVSNYFIISQFVDNSSIIYNLNNSLAQDYIVLVNALRARQGVNVCYLLQSQLEMPLSYYQYLFFKNIPSLDPTIEIFTKEVSNLSYASIYNKQAFTSFLVPLLQTDVCNTIAGTKYQYPDFNYTDCLTVGRGIMLKGFFVSNQLYVIRLKVNAEFVNSTNAAAYQIQFDKFNAAGSGLRQMQLKVYLTNLMDAMFIFFLDQNNILYEYYQYLSIWLLVYQISMISIIYFLGWRQYYKYINGMIFKARDLLDLFPIQILLQNSYVMSFLKKNS